MKLRHPRFGRGAERRGARRIVKTQDAPRPRPDPLRRFVSALLVASGLKPDRASALASLLLWFDTAGLLAHGVASLPTLLDRLDRGEIDPGAEGKVGPERAATAVLDGRSGPPLLVLARAAEIASEKAREVGVGLVKVRGIGPVGPASPVVADVAVGPLIVAALGPDGAWSAALPAPEGPPLVLDSAFTEGPAPAGIVPWAPLTLGGEWLVQAVAASAMEPLAGLHERVAEARARVRDSPLDPSRVEAHRREARESGIALDDATLLALRNRAAEAGVPDIFP